jgi:hypothetical protein
MPALGFNSGLKGLKKADFIVPVTGEMASDRIGFGTPTQNTYFPSSCQTTI